MNPTRLNLSDAIRQTAHPLTGATTNYDALLERVGSAQFVLIGEASHGTHDFYYERAEITKRLIQEKGFTAVAVEADWPDAYRINRFVRGASEDPTATESLNGFRRFPTWMWQNTDVLKFVVFHAVGLDRFWLPLGDRSELSQALRHPRLERAIGVIYRPETERTSHYFDAWLPDQFDAVIHIDNSRAVEPLDQVQPADGETPETYPSTL